MPIKITLDNVKNKLKEYDLCMIKEKYTNSKTKFDVKDGNGYKYRISYGEIVQYNKQVNKFSIYNPFTIENIKLWLILNNYKNKLLSTEYKSSEDKLIFKCEDCGQSYEVSFKHFRNANQIKCKKCRKILIAEKNRLSLNYIKEYFDSKELTLLDDSYEGVRQRLSACTFKGYKVKISYDSLKASGGVEIFSKYNPYTVHNINKYIELNNLTCKLTSKIYSASKDKLVFKCECGDEFKTTLDAFLHQDKNRCDCCTKKQSKLSYFTEIYLKSNKINYKYEHRLDDCRNIKPLPFDFAILDDDNKVQMLIELDGQQHYEPINFNGISDKIAIEKYEYTKFNDNIKNEYCINNNIPLLRVPYWEFKNSNYINILNSKLYTQV